MEELFNVEEVCEILGVTRWTLTNWYQWERLALEAHDIDARILPIPMKEAHSRGRLRKWTKSQVNELLNFQKNIIRGRNGFMGKVTNPKNRQAKNR